MKTLIIGHGGHGKDTAAEILCLITGQTFASSSEFACEHVVYPKMLELGHIYSTHIDCYNDRRNHRALWKSIISDYCRPKERLATDILKENDIYVGMRARDEFQASSHLFDLVLWIDRSKHLPPEDSNELRAEDADIIIDNNTNETDLFHRILDAQLDVLRKSQNEPN
ncbi:MAG: hypothetical protein P8P29_04615 [Flavobacteriaceae bacterium]|nr:hypothetical protein [Flavobacteriaceae bacterium]